jgi:ABC-type nitrate/sulfonate/bicarbonate transport system substrate-binding protein
MTLWWLTIACSAEPRAASDAPRKVRASAQRYLGHSIAYVGLADSLFAREGLDVEIVTAGSASEAMPLLLSGQIDVLFGSLTPGAINAMAVGQPVRIVAVRNVFDATSCASAGVVESVARPSPPRERPVIAVDRDLAWHYLVQRTLSKAGYRAEDYRWISVPNLAEVDGLQKGTIDYALSGEPWLTRTLAAKAARPWLSMDSLLHGEAYTYVLFGPSLLQENRETGAAVMRGYLAAVARFREGKTPRNLDILTAALGESRELLERTCWPAVSSDGRLRTGDITAFQEWALAHKYIARAATIDQVWDSSFVTAAARMP